MNLAFVHRRVLRLLLPRILPGVIQCIDAYRLRMSTHGCQDISIQIASVTEIAQALRQQLYLPLLGHLGALIPRPTAILDRVVSGEGGELGRVLLLQNAVAATLVVVPVEGIEVFAVFVGFALIRIILIFRVHPFLRIVQRFLL